MSSPFADETTSLSAAKSPRSVKSSGIGYVGKLGMVAVAYFNVCGGAVGSEQIVSYCGPEIGLLLFLVMALLFSVPEMFMTVELSAALPDNGGYCIWVQRAFGDYWGLQETIFTLVSSIFDQALYPVLMYSCIKSVFNNSMVATSLNSCQIEKSAALSAGTSDLWSCAFSNRSCASELAFKELIVLLFVAPACFPNHNFGMSCLVLMMISVIPQLLMTLVAAPEIHPAYFMQDVADKDYAGLFNVIFWSINGYSCLSTFANEVQKPIHRTMFEALSWSFVANILLLLIPLVVGALVDPYWHCWTDGSLTHVATVVGGKWLGYFVLLSSFFSNWGMFTSEFFESTYQLLGNAESGLLPDFFSGRSTYTGAPLNAAIFMTVIICVLVGMDFSALLAIDNYFACLGFFLQFAALVKLRISEPDLERPWKIPGGTWGLALLLVPCISILVAVTYFAVTGSRATTVLCVSLTLFSLLVCLPMTARSTDTTG